MIAALLDGDYMMLTFSTVRKSIEVTFQEDSEIALCPVCSSPNAMDEGHCIDCGAPLHTSPRVRFALARDVRKCRGCGHYNRIKDNVCANRTCSAQLTEEDTPEPERMQKGTIRYVKICPEVECGHTNPSGASVCELCGRSLDLIDDIAIKDGNTSSAVETATGGYVEFINIRTGEHTRLQVGDRQTIGYDLFLGTSMKSCDYVGNSHADVDWEGKELFITDHSRNGTYINGRRIEKNVRTVVRENSVIGLGDPSPNEALAAFFKVEYHVY